VADSRDGVTSKGSCSVVLQELARGDMLLYEFGVAPKAEMSLLLVLRARGGTAAM
jgi:hypothetical protein